MLRSVHILIFVFSILSISTLLAQSNSYSLKVYANFGYSDESKNEMFYKENLVKSFESQYDLGYFSPAFTFYKESGSFHEFEIARIKSISEDYFIMNKDFNGQISEIPRFAVKQLTNKLALRYEYAHKLKFGSQPSRFETYIGLSGSPYYRMDKIIPKTNDLFGESQSQLGLQISIVPRIVYNITENWFFDLNIPISVLDMARITFKSENPVRDLEQRKINSSEISVFPKNYLLRVGVGLRI